MAIEPKMARSDRGPTRRLSLVAVASVIFVACILVRSSNYVDHGQARAEQNLLAHGVSSRYAELEGVVQAEAGWDDAVTHLDRRFDPAWAQANIGDYLYQVAAFDQIFILDQTDHPIYAMRGGLEADPKTFGHVAAIAAVVAEIRRQEALRRPQPVRRAGEAAMPAPMQAMALAQIGGAPHLIIASRVQPYFGAVVLRGPTAPIVVVTKPINAAFVSQLADRYQLMAVRLTPAGEVAQKGDEALPLTDAAGRPLAQIQWTPRRPGAEMLRNAAWLSSLLLAALFVSLWLIHRSAQRALTDLLRAQSSLKAALIAERAANEAKSEFLASVSHEIRTPLNGVLGAVHLLKGEPVSDEGGRLIQYALASGEMVNALINDVLDYSKIVSGAVELSAAPTDVRAIVETVVTTFKAQCETKGVGLRFEIAPDVAWATLDPLRLRQCLFNLVGNAVKFTSAGRITVRTSMRYEFDKALLSIAVADTGVGVPLAAQSMIFERFKQADGSTTRRFGGTGLGLAITRSLARLMGGDVSVVSEVGVGSTFTLEVLAPRSVAPDFSEAAAASNSVFSGLNILIVDDNPGNLLIATTMLKRMGAVVTTAGGGQEAIDLARADPPDLILMDIQMPKMDGMEATRRLRLQGGPLGETLIIALTANVLDHDRTKYLAAGMNGVVGKPITPSLLIAEIQRVLAV